MGAEIEALFVGGLQLLAGETRGNDKAKHLLINILYRHHGVESIVMPWRGKHAYAHTLNLIKPTNFRV